MAALSMMRFSQGFNLLYISTVPRNVPGRNISKKKLLNKLNLPVQPKKPPSSFILFYVEVKDKLKSQEPGCDGENLLKKCGSLWKELSSEKKEKYQKKYEVLKENYSKEKDKYEEELTPEQKMQLRSFSVHYQNVKDAEAATTMRRQKEKEFNKPKAPTPPFTKFALEMKHDGMSLKEACNIAKEKWYQLPERVKEKYLSKYKDELEQYKKDKEAWEEEMIQKGHTDIVRLKTLKVKMSDS